MLTYETYCLIITCETYCFSREVGLDDLLRSLSTLVVMWFCESRLIIYSPINTILWTFYLQEAVM